MVKKRINQLYVHDIKQLLNVRHFLVVLSLLVLPLFAIGQENEVSKKKDRKYAFYFAFDGRKSFVNTEPNSLAGLRLGLEHKKKKFRYGLGLYFLRNEIDGDDKYVDDLGDTLDIRYAFGYPSIFYEKILLKNHKWELNSAIILGAGDHDTKVGRPGEGFKSIKRIKSTVWELNGTADYYLTDWLALGSGVGYRLIVGANEDIREAYSSPIYIVKLKLKIFKLYHSLRNKEQNNE